MRIAVLGGGHGSYASAADLAEQGHEVRWWRRDRAALAGLAARGTLRLRDSSGVREIRISKLTPDIGEAVRGAELVLAPVPATAQADIAQAMTPHLERGQVVFCPPGTFGSYAMAKIVREAGGEPRIAFDL